MVSTLHYLSSPGANIKCAIIVLPNLYIILVYGANPKLAIEYGISNNYVSVSVASICAKFVTYNLHSIVTANIISNNANLLPILYDITECLN